MENLEHSKDILKNIKSIKGNNVKSAFNKAIDVVATYAQNAYEDEKTTKSIRDLKVQDEKKIPIAMHHLYKILMTSTYFLKPFIDDVMNAIEQNYSGRDIWDFFADATVPRGPRPRA